MCGVMTTQPESREALLAKLEQMTGRALRTPEDVRTFVSLLQQHEDDAAKRSFDTWRTVKRCALVALLGLALGQYYVIEVLTQLASLHENTFFVPASVSMVRSALAALGYFS